MTLPSFRSALVFAALLTACGGPDVTVNLISRNDSGQSGTAKLYDKGENTEVVIETSTGTDNNDQEAFINTGPCSSTGLLVGVPLENLTEVHLGLSTTLVEDRRLADLQGSRYHIDIQNSANPLFVNACGDIP